MNRAIALIAAAAIAVTLSGCTSMGGSPSGQPSGNVTMDTAPAAPASAVAAPSPTGPCTTHACIVTDAESLKGTVAKDNSVMTKITCKGSTVKEVVSETYTVHCRADYSDGSVADGIASVLLASGDVDWEPTSIISDGSGD